MRKASVSYLPLHKSTFLKPPLKTTARSLNFEAIMQSSIAKIHHYLVDKGPGFNLTMLYVENRRIVSNVLLEEHPNFIKTKQKMKKLQTKFAF